MMICVVIVVALVVVGVCGRIVNGNIDYSEGGAGGG